MKSRRITVEVPEEYFDWAREVVARIQPTLQYPDPGVRLLRLAEAELNRRQGINDLQRAQRAEIWGDLVPRPGPRPPGVGT